MRTVRRKIEGSRSALDEEKRGREEGRKGRKLTSCMTCTSYSIESSQKEEDVSISI